MIRLLEPWRTRLLWLSLGANLFAAAIIVAPYVWHTRSPGPPSFDMVIERLARSLPASDASTLRAAMARERPYYDMGRQQLTEARAEIGRTMAAEPFDPAAARTALVGFQSRMRDYSARFDDSLVSALGTLSPEARTHLAKSFIRGPR